jgi:hypothetical protein
VFFKEDILKGTFGQLLFLERCTQLGSLRCWNLDVYNGRWTRPIIVFRAIRSGITHIIKQIFSSYHEWLSPFHEAHLFRRLNLVAWILEEGRGIWRDLSQDVEFAECIFSFNIFAHFIITPWRHQHLLKVTYDFLTKPCQRKI